MPDKHFVIEVLSLSTCKHYFLTLTLGQLRQQHHERALPPNLDWFNKDLHSSGSHIKEELFVLMNFWSLLQIVNTKYKPYHLLWLFLGHSFS